ncbi:MAG: hypothetical protein L0Z53_17470 [Acidobacteriales bacterium]|nr:hypothetical protein [Terriglobales bacterium]
MSGPSPPSLPSGAHVRWRPLVPISVIGPGGLFRDFGRAVLDPAADDTVFPLDTAWRIGITLRLDTGHRVRWRGQMHPLRFGDVELLLTDQTSVWRWPAVVAFSPAPIRYPILGQASCLQFFDTQFLGADRFMELETNHDYPGTVSP